MNAMKQFLRKVGIVAGTVLMAGVAAPLLVPLPPLDGTVPPEDLADGQSTFVSLGDIKVHCRRSGNKGSCFLLLHGYLRSIFSWQSVIDSLASLGVAIAYDRPAFGLTTRPMPGEWKGSNPYGYRGQTVMLIQLMDALSVDKAILIGHGMGAGIAALTAQLYPRRVERLVLVAPDPPEQGLPGWQRLFMATPQMRRLGPVLLRGRVMRQIDEMLQRLRQDSPQAALKMKEEYEKILRVNDWDRALWELAHANEPLEKLLSPESLQSPTLVVAGEKDSVDRYERIVRLAARIPHSNLALIPDAVDAPHEETPDAFMEAIKEFLATPMPVENA